MPNLHINVAPLVDLASKNSVTEFGQLAYFAYKDREINPDRVSLRSIGKRLDLGLRDYVTSDSESPPIGHIKTRAVPPYGDLTSLLWDSGPDLNAAIPADEIATQLLNGWKTLTHTVAVDIYVHSDWLPYIKREPKLEHGQFITAKLMVTEWYLRLKRDQHPAADAWHITSTTRDPFMAANAAALTQIDGIRTAVYAPIAFPSAQDGLRTLAKHLSKAAEFQKSRGERLQIIGPKTRLRQGGDR